MFAYINSFNRMLPKHKHVKKMHTYVQMIISFAALIRSIVRTYYVVRPLADSHQLFINDNTLLLHSFGSRKSFSCIQILFWRLRNVC